jgi:hypothetical protein
MRARAGLFVSLSPFHFRIGQHAIRNFFIDTHMGDRFVVWDGVLHW